MALNRGSSATLFAADASGTLRLIGYIALACVMMVADRHLGILVKARYAAAAVIEPVYELAALPARVVHDADSTLTDRRRLIDDNEKLRQALLLANARLHRMQTLADQNQRLKQLLDVQHTLGVNVQLARVLDVDLGAFRYRLMIEAGADAGVTPGMVVVDAHGVMGQVVEVSPHTARVMLVTDPNHAVPVVDERSGVRAVAVGDGASGHLRLATLPLTADIKAGDQLLTSGIGGRFPAGFPVGRVVTVAPDRDGSFKVAQVVPAAAPERSGEVLLLRDQPPPVGPPAPAASAGPPADLAAPAAASSAVTR